MAATEIRIPISDGLFSFNGGIHPPINKDMSVQVPLKTASLPSELVLPLQQHIGQIAEPIVSVGERVLKGQQIAKAPSYVSAPIHAPTSGMVTHIGDKPIPHSSGLEALCLTIEPDGQEEWCELHPVADYSQLDAITLRNKVRDAGIVGLGGAAFPSSVKLNPGPNRTVEKLIINGAECEPYITCDQTLMSERAEEVIAGIQIILHTLGVNECWIGIEDTMPTALEGLEQAIRIAGEEQRIQVKVIPTIYPTGGEKQLIKVLTGKEVPSNGLPAEVGIVCHNPGTAAAIYRAVVKGEPLISRLLTVTGKGVQQPRNLEVLFGTPMSHLIEEAGGYTANPERLIMGGPMMGFAMHTDELPIVKATNCILVGEAGEIAEPPPADPCIRCGACADACPANLLPQQLYWYSKSRQFEEAQENYNLFDCIECGCCSYVCPSHIPLVQYYRFAKTEIRGAEADKRKAEHARERHEFREERLEREQREKAEALRKKKEELERKKAASGDKGDNAKPGQDAIAAAVARAAARKAKLAEEGKGPKNTAQLSPEQAAQVAKTDERRASASGNDQQAAIAAAKAKAAAVAAAKAKAQQGDNAGSGKDDAKQAAIAAAKAKATAAAQSASSASMSTEIQVEPEAADPKQAAIAAAKARAQAKQQSGDAAQEQDPKAAAIAAAKAKALAKAQSKTDNDPKQAAIAAAKARAQAKTQEPEQDAESETRPETEQDPKQAAIAAAKARALAKAKGEDAPSAEPKTDAKAAQDPKAAAIAAAKARALAKSQDTDATAPADSTDNSAPVEDPKQAAIRAAKERALAKATQGNTANTENPSDAELDPKQAAIKAARERALAKQQEQQD